MKVWQCQCCGDYFSDTCIGVGGEGINWPVCRQCAVGIKDYEERLARGDCHCCMITPSTRPGPNGGHWHDDIYD